MVLGGLGAAVATDGDTEYFVDTILFSSPIIDEYDEYVIVDMPETTEMLLKQGRPMVPQYVHTYTFPFGTTIKSVTCTAVSTETMTIDKDVMMTPPIATVGYEYTGVPAHSYEEPYPDMWYEYDVYSGIRGHEQHIIVKVAVYPIQYDPTQQHITWADEVDIQVDYASPGQSMNLDDEYLLVIIGADEFSDECAPLVTHKNNNMGVSTIFVGLSEIYGGTYFPATGRDNQEKIKYFIKNAIENWGTSYIMLVGSSSKLPVRITHVRANQQDDELFVSDLYYADIYDGTGGFCSWDSNENDIFGEYDWGSSHAYDEVDLVPDVYLGRLACTSGTEATRVVNKIIAYEQGEAYTQEWFTDLVVIGGDSFPGDDNQIDEGEYVNQEVIDIMEGFIPTKLWASLGLLSGYVPTGAARINNEISDGCGFVDFSGHGNTMVWATHPHEDDTTWLPTPTSGYLNSHISTLTNGNKLPIVITGACSVSKFNVDPGCFGWAWLTSANGGGIAHLGATGLGWAYIGEYVTQGLVEGMALDSFRAYKEQGAITFGELWAKAIESYIFPGMEGTDYKTVEEWQPFGDPSLKIAEESQAPAKPNPPNGPTSGKIRTTYTYTASTTDPDGDKIYYLFDWGDGTYSGWVGPYNSGVQGEASHRWTEQGAYEIRVKAKDDHGVQSEWSNPLSINMPKTRFVHNSFVLRLLERFPHAFPLLRTLLGL